jgi:hypothetical protein
MDNIKITTLASDSELEKRKKFLELYKECPIPENEILSNIGLFEKRQEITKQLFLNEIYREIVNVHGVIIEFGVRWGQNLVTLNNLRAIYEPYNYNRKIIGFDTFDGFPVVAPEDGTNEIIKAGAFSVTKDYGSYLEEVLNYHESECPMSHIKKNYIVKGDATVEFEKYLNDNPETIVAFAYFDFDIYTPTKKCLELLKQHLTKGSVIGFDELNDHKFPGETLALKEAFGLNRYKIQRNMFSCMQSFLIIE